MISWARPRVNSPSSHACLYLATAPKSNAAYAAAQGRGQGGGRHRLAARRRPHILNAPTRLMKDMGYRQGLCL